MINQVLDTIHRYGLLSKGDRCIVGLSGGADSVALFLALCTLRDELGIELQVVHVHHGLRGKEADEDMRFVQELCSRYGIVSTVYFFDVSDFARKQKKTVEEAGRELRYKAFYDTLRKWKNIEETTKEKLNDNTAKVWENSYGRAKEPVRYRIALAHHLEDNAETVLMNLVRGSGLTGLCGILPEREEIIRPLLFIHREEIEAYLLSAGQSYRIDSSNLEENYTRNIFRRRIMPMLSQINPKAAEHIADTARLLVEADGYIRSEAKRAVENMNCMAAGEWQIPIARFCGYPEILRKEILRLALAELSGGLKDISQKHIEAADRLAKSLPGKRLSLPYGMYAYRNYLHLCIGANREHTKALPQQEHTVFLHDLWQKKEGIYVGGFFLRIFLRDKSRDFPIGEEVKWFAAEKFGEKIAIRRVKQGDRISLSQTASKNLRNFMTDAKIPARDRDQLTVIASGSDVVWLVGYRIGARYKLKADTDYVLEIRR